MRLLARLGGWPCSRTTWSTLLRLNGGFTHGNLFETPKKVSHFHVNECRLVGVLHLLPLSGAANYDGCCVRAMAAVATVDAKVLEDAGFTDVMVQSGGGVGACSGTPA